MTNQNGNCIAGTKKDNWVIPEERKLTSVVYKFSDGTEKEVEPYPTPLEVLEQLKEDKATVFDCLELLYKPLSKLDSTLGVVTRYLIDELGYTEKQAEKEINEVLEQWL